MCMAAPNANIHYYPVTNTLHCDDEDDPLYGYYYEITPGELMGPYSSAKEAELACHVAWQTNDY